MCVPRFHKNLNFNTSMGDVTGSEVCSAASAPVRVKEKIPDYQYYENRLRSFENWPRFFHTKPEALAHAGFVSINRGDCVQCFSCKGELNDWKDQGEN